MFIKIKLEMKIIDWCRKRPSKLILFERIRRFRYIVVFISINSADSLLSQRNEKYEFAL